LYVGRKADLPPGKVGEEGVLEEINAHQRQHSACDELDLGRVTQHLQHRLDLRVACGEVVLDKQRNDGNDQSNAQDFQHHANAHEPQYHQCALALGGGKQYPNFSTGACPHFYRNTAHTYRATLIHFAEDMKTFKPRLRDLSI